MSDEVDRGLAPSDEASYRGEALAEGTHDQVYMVCEAKVIADATTVVTEYAEAVGLVDHDRCSVLLGQLDDLGELAEVTLHPEDAIDDDELDTLGVALL